MRRHWERGYFVDQILASGEDAGKAPPQVYSTDGLTRDQLRTIDDRIAESTDASFPGRSFGYNPFDPDLREDGTKPAWTDMDAVRQEWLSGNVPEQDRGKNAVIGAVGLYSVIQDLGPGSEGLEDALYAFFDDAKRIAQQSANEAIYGPSDPDGPSLNQQSLDAIKALASTVQYAGLANTADPEDARQRGDVYVLGQAISACEADGDGLEFMNEVARVVQDNNWTQDIEADLERMGKQERVNALLYREPESVPEGHRVDEATREAMQDLADGIG